MYMVAVLKNSRSYSFLQYSSYHSWIEFRSGSKADEALPNRLFPKHLRVHSNISGISLCLTRSVGSRVIRTLDLRRSHSRVLDAATPLGLFRNLNLLERQPGTVAENELAVPRSHKHAVRVDIITNVAPLLQRLAIHLFDLPSVGLKVLGPVRLAAKITHEPLKGLIVSRSAGRISMIWPVEGSVQVQRGLVVIRDIEVRARV